ncbi:MAG: hypothetical protein J5857_12220 [Treponema sp.]|nr:hypothetical protein [Treponema sp.]
MRTIAEIDAEIAETQQELDTVRGDDTEVYARIVGYYRSVRNWNKGKRDEYNQRLSFTVPENLAEPSAFEAVKNTRKMDSIQLRYQKR